MIIKKLSEEILEIVKREMHTIEINDKKVRIYEYTENMDGYYDNNNEIDEVDKEKLTEDELEAINDYMGEILDTKENETFDTEE